MTQVVVVDDEPCILRALRYLAAHPGASCSPAAASIHAYTVGFTARAVIFAAGLLLALVLLLSRHAIQDRVAARGHEHPEASIH